MTADTTNATGKQELIFKIFDDIINNGRYELAPEYVSEDYVEYAMDGEHRGVDGFLEVVQAFRDGFPDLHATVSDVVLYGDRAAWRVSMTGTHQRDWMGIPATGKRITVESIEMVKMADGKATEHRSAFDTLGLLQQLGVVPS